MQKKKKSKCNRRRNQNLVLFLQLFFVIWLTKKSQFALWIFTAGPPVSSKKFYQNLRARGGRKSSKHKNHLLRQIQSRKGNIWLTRWQEVVGFGAVHSWNGGWGGQPAFCLRTEWCTRWGHCRGLNITDKDTQAHARKNPRLPAHTYTKTITFLCFYECFINHVNGSQSYTPKHNYSLHRHTHSCSFSHS